MPGKLTPFTSATARAAGLKAGAIRAAQAALRKRTLSTHAKSPDTFPERLALEREGLLVLLQKERNKKEPDPVKVKGWLEALSKLLVIERAVSKSERNGAERREARPVPEPVSHAEPKTDAPIVREESESSEENPTQTGTLSDYPG